MPDLVSLLRALSTAGIQFILVGGAAAVMHRVPVTTLDVDVVHERSPENVARLIALLKELGALVRDPAGRKLFPSAEHLRGCGQVLLTTRLGDLDCLGTLHDGRGYQDLLPHVERIRDGGVELLVLDLPSLIEVKTKAGRIKDRMVVPVLLAELRRRSNKPVD